MAKKAYGFTSKNDADRVVEATRKVERMQMTGTRHRRKYPLGNSKGVVLRRAIVVNPGFEGVHEILFVTGTFLEQLEGPAIKSNTGTTPAYCGDWIAYQLEAGDHVIVAEFDGNWWIVEASQECHGGCVAELDPVGEPNWTRAYKWYLPQLSCCTEGAKVFVMTSLGPSQNWESQEFQCNADGIDRKWIYDGKKVWLSPSLDTGKVVYQQGPDASLCPVKMYQFEATPREDDCTNLPRVACMVPMCARGYVGSCRDGSNRNWVIEFDGPAPTPTTAPKPGEDYSGQCDAYVSGIELSRRFDCGNTTFSTVCNLPEGDNVFTHLPTEGLDGDINLSPSNGVFESELSFGVGAVYRPLGWNSDPLQPFNCTGLNEWELYQDAQSSQAKCTDWPATCRTYPIDDEFVESKCYPNALFPLHLDNIFPQTDANTHCADTPFVLTLEVSGVTNNNCVDCADFVKTYELKSWGKFGVNNAAIWLSDAFTVECDDNSQNPFNLWWQLRITQVAGGGVVELKCGNENFQNEFPGNPKQYVRYELWESAGGTNPGITGWNCFGDNVFQRKSNSTDCSWPSTVTVKQGGSV